MVSIKDSYDYNILGLYSPIHCPLSFTAFTSLLFVHYAANCLLVVPHYPIIQTDISFINIRFPSLIMKNSGGAGGCDVGRKDTLLKR